SADLRGRSYAMNETPGGRACSPSAERQLIGFFDSHYEGDGYPGAACFGQNQPAIRSVRQQTISIESHPLACILFAVLEQPLLFLSALGVRPTRITIAFISLE